MKSYKRETALLLVFYIFYIGVAGDFRVLEVVIWPFMLFVGGAFGMEWAAKQTNLVSSPPKKDLSSANTKSSEK